MSNIYDIAIIGMGVAGVFCTYNLATKHKNIKVLGIDLGRPMQKRKRQIEGWFGCLTAGDGKLYQTDLDKVINLTGQKKAKIAHSSFKNSLNEIGKFKIIKDRSPNISMEKKLTNIGYDITLNNYIQIYPKDIHALSKYMAETIEKHKNVTYSFDNEVKKIYKQKNIFSIITDEQEFKCKKIVIAVGRSGWRWAKEVYSDFGIIDNNDIARFGVRIEISAQVMKDFNKSNCTLNKGDDIEIGPFSWNGTIIPEDHVDVAISAFRSNEARWKSDKVSFSLIGNRYFPQNGFEQTDRISKLAFVLSNDRIIKERVSSILTGKSKISIIPEYNWLKDTISELGQAIPEILSKGYYHIPTIMPMAPKINLGNNLESEIDNMFIVGESAGVHGIFAAGLMGIIAADSVCKK